MKLLQTLKDAQIQARVARNLVSANLYTTILGEVERNASKDTSDGSIVKVLIKMKESVLSVIQNTPTTDNRHQIALQELTLIEQHLPKELDNARLENIVTGFKVANPSAKMGELMKELQRIETEQGVLIDKKYASQVFNRKEA